MARYVYVGDENGKSVPLHRKVWETANGPIPEGHVIHHINGDSKDNRLENLVCMSKQEHIRLHASMRAEGVDVTDMSDPDVVDHKKRRQIWHQQHKEEENAKSRAYHAAHKEEINARSRRNAKLYAQRHPEKIKQYREANKERIRARESLYKKAHREAINAKKRLERAVKRGASSEIIDKIQQDVQAANALCDARWKNRA